MAHIPSINFLDKVLTSPGDRLSGTGLPWPLHEACLAWPEMSPSDLRNLADDIATYGLRDPITLTPDGLLLDGRNRARACVMAAVEPATVIYDGDPWVFSLSRNKHRRHMTPDQVAMAAAKLVTTTQGMNRFVDSSFELSIAKAAEAVGVSETSIKSAKAVIKYGTPEEAEAINLGRMPLRKTADHVRERRRALAPPAPPKPTPKPAQPVVDSTDAVADEIIANCSDGKWKSSSKIAAAVKVTETTAKEALKSLGGCVTTRVNGAVVEYQIESSDEAHLRRLLAAKDREIADLKKQIAEKDAEIEQLKKVLDAPSASVPPARKKQRAKPESDSANLTVN